MEVGAVVIALGYVEETERHFDGVLSISYCIVLPAISHGGECNTLISYPKPYQVSHD